MLKLISKINCPRCEEIKNYLDGRGIIYEVEMAEVRGYDYWRSAVAEMTGKMGFPILITNILSGPENWVNGSTEEIIEKISEITLAGKPENTQEEKKDCKSPHYFWAKCPECGYDEVKHEENTI